jgi:hypothetical protein
MNASTLSTSPMVLIDTIVQWIPTLPSGLIEIEFEL